MEPGDIEVVKRYVKATADLRRNRSEKDDLLAFSDPNKITNGLILMDSVPPARVFHSVPNPVQFIRKWHYSTIVFGEEKAQELAPKLQSWTEAERESNPAYFTKFNLPFRMPTFTEADYSRLYANAPANLQIWNFAEIQHLFELLELYEGNFYVVCDRYSDSKSFDSRPIEDIKEQTFYVCKTLLETRSGDAKDDYKHLQYNREFEHLRRLKTQKFYARTSAVQQQEEELLSQMRQLEIQVRRKEKETQSFKRIMELTKDEKIEMKEHLDSQLESSVPMDLDVKSNPIVVSRASFFDLPLLNLGPLTNRKLELALADLDLPENLCPTEDNTKMMEQLKMNLLKLFKLNFVLQQKQKAVKKFKDRREIQDQNLANEPRSVDAKDETQSLKKVKTEATFQ